MAEGFARAYGSDVMEPESAGLAPALSIAPLTHKVMLEKNIDLGHMYPRSAGLLKGRYDLVINMSGGEVPKSIKAPVEEWEVHDPIGEPEEVFREVRDQIEQRVMGLVNAMRNRKPPRSEGPAAVVPSRAVDSHRQPPRK